MTSQLWANFDQTAGGSSSDGGLGRPSSVSSSWLQALSSEASTIVSSSQSLSSGSLWILERQTRQLSNFAIRAVSRKEIVWSEAKFLRGNNLFKMYLDNYDENDYGDDDDRLSHMMSGKESWKRGFKEALLLLLSSVLVLTRIYGHMINIMFTAVFVHLSNVYCMFLYCMYTAFIDTWSTKYNTVQYSKAHVVSIKGESWTNVYSSGCTLYNVRMYKSYTSYKWYTA